MLGQDLQERQGGPSGPQRMAGTSGTTNRRDPVFVGMAFTGPWPERPIAESGKPEAPRKAAIWLVSKSFRGAGARAGRRQERKESLKILETTGHRMVRDISRRRALAPVR